MSGRKQGDEERRRIALTLFASRRLAGGAWSPRLQAFESQPRFFCSVSWDAECESDGADLDLADLGRRTQWSAFNSRLLWSPADLFAESSLFERCSRGCTVSGCSTQLGGARLEGSRIECGIIRLEAGSRSTGNAESSVLTILSSSELVCTVRAPNPGSIRASPCLFTSASKTAQLRAFRHKSRRGLSSFAPANAPISSPGTTDLGSLVSG